MKIPLLRMAIVPAALFMLSASDENSIRNVATISPGPEWKVFSIFSGKNNYYTFEEQDGTRFIRARYNPKFDTVILYRKLEQPKRYYVMHWKWRVHKFPIGADEMVPGRMDSAASIYIYFQSGFRKFVIKYVWSVMHPKGKNFLTDDSSYFNKMQLVVLEGPPMRTDEWVPEDVDIASDFRRFFLEGKEEEIPPVIGIGILSDGDGTQSFVEADYADFQLAE